MIEAVTDPDPVFGPPDSRTAWEDAVNGEIGDICAHQDATLNAVTVQKMWSNQLNKCIVDKCTAADNRAACGEKHSLCECLCANASCLCIRECGVTNCS